MKPLLPTLTINVDEIPYEVAKLPPEIQQIVAYHDDWRQQEVDLTSKVLMARHAVQQIQTQLLEKIQQFKAAKSEDPQVVDVATTSPVVSTVVDTPSKAKSKRTAK